ncbi:MAG: class II glutamine amidotransferase [Oscillospiraceae bacterium]|nr:class II glutamine amidotransferase [Oscillospiraceae bacterium]
MCAIFGLIDYKRVFTAAQRECFMNVLATECEIRGTDATGFAFNSGGKLKIYKRPVAAHELSLKLSEDANVILGHTRMATQGDCKLNYNNHPFFGKVRGTKFVLAHNGIVYNDSNLYYEMKLPKTRIETDSYVAVQMIEKSGELSEKSLAEMAEKIRGSFVFTLLDERNNSYFVRGDNPLALYHFKDGFYAYASTDTILKNALFVLGLHSSPYEEIASDCGDILKIDSSGKLTRSKFNQPIVGNYFGYSPMRSYGFTYDIPEEYIDLMLDYGYTLEDVEDLCGIPEAIETTVSEILCEYGYCDE